MDKTERNKLRSEGCEIFRARCNSKGKWQVCRQTVKGGWEIYNDEIFNDRFSCEIYLKKMTWENKNIIID